LGNENIKEKSPDPLTPAEIIYLAAIRELQFLEKCRR
jgi:hypothetical protein